MQGMKDLNIRVNDSLTVKTGDFGTVVRNGILFIPQCIYNMLAREGVYWASALVNYLRTWQLHKQLEWTKEDWAAAMEKLIAQLAEHIDDKFLHPEPFDPDEFGTGALLPEDE